MIRVKAPAKINLTLDVLSKRSDGYHDVKMVMTTIDLADYVSVKKNNTNEIRITSNSFRIPLSEENLTHKAAKLFKIAYNINTGVDINIEKNIFISAGLAGGSSDAAATLKGLRELFKVDCTDEELAVIGGEIGSDIPFCIYGGTAIATGRGEIINPIKSPPKCWVILVNPRIGVPTREIFDNFTAENIMDIDTDGMTTAIEKACFSSVCASLGNSLESVTFKLYPEVAKIKNKLTDAGAEGVLMSGSGPTIFGLVYTEKKANAVFKQTKSLFPKYDVHMVRLLG